MSAAFVPVFFAIAIVTAGALPLFRAAFPGRCAEPGVAHGQVRAFLDFGDIGQEHRLAILEADDEVGDIVGVGEERSCRHRRIAILGDAIAGLARRRWRP